jgi:hypothetical protein
LTLDLDLWQRVLFGITTDEAGMTDRRQDYIESARHFFNLLAKGEGNPLNLVPAIRNALANAGEEADVLDLHGRFAASVLDLMLEACEKNAPSPIEAARRKYDPLLLLPS